MDVKQRCNEFTISINKKKHNFIQRLLIISTQQISNNFWLINIFNNLKYAKYQELPPTTIKR